MARFDPTSTVITWGPSTAQGVMDGEYFSAERSENGMEIHVGSQGFATFVVNANESGMFKVTLSQESPTNREWSIFEAAKTIQMFQMEDLGDGALVTGPETAIQKHAPIKRGNKVIGMEWTFICARLKLVAGGDQ